MTIMKRRDRERRKALRKDIGQNSYFCLERQESRRKQHLSWNLMCQWELLWAEGKWHFSQREEHEQRWGIMKGWLPPAFSSLQVISY